MLRLNKLLIYCEGSHFSKHRDGEKGKGMFGTLTIALPSEYEGGDFVIHHQGIFYFFHSIFQI